MNNESIPADTRHDRIIQWGLECLSSFDYTLTISAPETVQDTPWSWVICFVTSHGYIYLKHTPAQLALEADIIKILRNQFRLPVPEIIAHNSKLCCFMMKDAGRKLRDILRHKFDSNLACRAAGQFASFQSSVAGHLDELFKLGVPDWRLDRFTELYSEVLNQKNLLESDGLSTSEIERLAALIPDVSHLSKKLTGYAVKQTIVQPDFNDNNILIQDISGDLTVIDLGEIAISHPFFSMINFLHQLKKYHALNEEDDAYKMIRDCYLQTYMGSDLDQDIRDAFTSAEVLSPVYGIFALYRLILACREEKSAPSLHSKLRESLRNFMHAFKINHKEIP